MKIFIVEDLEGELEKNAEFALLRLVMASQRGELKLRKRNVTVIGGPAAGPDTVRVTFDIDVPLVHSST